MSRIGQVVLVEARFLDADRYAERRIPAGVLVVALVHFQQPAARNFRGIGVDIRVRRFDIGAVGARLDMLVDLVDAAILAVDVQFDEARTGRPGHSHLLAQHHGHLVPRERLVGVVRQQTPSRALPACPTAAPRLRGAGGRASSACSRSSCRGPEFPQGLAAGRTRGPTRSARSPTGSSPDRPPRRRPRCRCTSLRWSRATPAWRVAEPVRQAEWPAQNSASLSTVPTHRRSAAQGPARSFPASPELPMGRSRKSRNRRRRQAEERVETTSRRRKYFIRASLSLA